MSLPKIVQTLCVTPKFLTKGKKSSLNSCPIALVLKAEGFKKVEVEYEYITFSKDKKSYYACPSMKLKRFIERFDHDRVKLTSSYKFRLVAALEAV